jgi:hypothetical protein
MGRFTLVADGGGPDAAHGGAAATCCIFPGVTTKAHVAETGAGPWTLDAPATSATMGW